VKRRFSDSKRIDTEKKVIRLKIDDLTRAGTGVGRDDGGRAIFVPYTAPGDVVDAQLTFESERYAEAKGIQWIELSPLRVKPRCAVFGKCGGCDWQHLPAEFQWQTKVRGLLHALKRVGLTELPSTLVEMPASQVWGYRNRIQLRGEGETLGFFAAGSRDLVPIDRCEIADERINRVIPEIKQVGAQRKDAQYKVELEVLPNGEVASAWNRSHAALGFRQVHDKQNEVLRNWVRDQVEEAWKDLGVTAGWIYDLYGGNGNLSDLLEGQSSGVDCVDLTAPESQTSSWRKFHRQPVAVWVRKATKGTRSPGPNLAILDPAREGLGRDFQVIDQGLVRLGVSRVIYVGCDVDSFCRDVLKFVRNGYELLKLGALDFFPQTPHLESLAVLRRKVGVKWEKSTE
jgi:tRNA/tmRNA/rRNA uracil-C5-methylase (TrmA/RlmC/RlmD family)